MRLLLASAGCQHQAATTSAGSGSFPCLTPALIFCRSGDSTIRLWDLSQPDDGDGSPAVLEHWQQAQQPSKDITVVDWRSDGTLLASGSVDGNARIWSSSGSESACAAGCCRHLGYLLNPCTARVNVMT